MFLFFNFVVYLVIDIQCYREILNFSAALIKSKNPTYNDDIMIQIWINQFISVECWHAFNHPDSKLINITQDCISEKHISTKKHSSLFFFRLGWNYNKGTKLCDRGHCKDQVSLSTQPWEPGKIPVQREGSPHLQDANTYNRTGQPCGWRQVWYKW